MADTRGCWSLSEAWAEKGAAEWVPLPEVWLSADNNTGYWIGGGPSPVSKSVVDKMNYSSNTTARVPGADISVPKNDTTCAGTSTEGFAFYGFNGSSYFTTVERISYATDTHTLMSDKLRNPARSAACAIGSPTKAYIVNGYYPGGPYNETTTWVYATSATDTMPGVGSYFSMAGSGNTTHGYVGGGPNPNSFMFKFTYASDSEAQLPSAPLSTPGGRKKPLSAASSTGSYFSGGNPGPMTTTDKLTFATDACARIPGADALSGIAYMQGTGNSNSAYMLNWNAVTFQNLSYSTDTYSNLPGSANLSVNRGTSFGCVSGQGNNQPEATVSETRWFDGDTGSTPAIYFDGENDYMRVRNWDSNSRFSAYAMTWECWVKFTASDGTLDTLWDNRSHTNADDGFLIGRFHTSGHENKIEMYTAGDYRITTDVTVADNVWTHVAFARVGNSATSRIYINGTEAGSFTDGYNYDNTGTGYIGCNVAVGYFFQGYITNMRYVKGACLYTSNFTVPDAPLTSTSQGATESSGDAGTKFIVCNTSTTDGSTVLADSLTLSASNFTSGESGVSPQPGVFGGPPAATPTSSTTTLKSVSGVPNTGYFGGGDPGNNSSVKRFNFSNETTSTIPARLSQARELTGGTSSITYGYFSGGRSPYYSITDRVTYSNDTVGRIPGANTITNIADCMGSGVRSYGILGGGMSPTLRNYAQKVSFADETISNDGSLPEGRHAAAVVTEPETAAYFMAGTTPAGSDKSTIDKYTFSTSTGSAYPANTLFSKGYQTGMGSLTAGYVSGGPLGGGAGKTSVDKLTYSTSTWSTLSDTMSGGKYLCGGLNNTLFGVFCGGIPSSPGPDGGDTTQKVTFSTETVAKIPGANWDDNWYRINGAGAQMNSAYATNPNVI